MTAFHVIKVPRRSAAPADASLDFEGRRVTVTHGDTIASALYRAGVRVFSRSFKYHRPRGLYCLTGDCPNCMVSVDGLGWVKACVAAAKSGQAVRRQRGWPSADRDILGLFDRAHRLLPVGFYYKTGLRPQWLWPRLEPLIRRAASSAPVVLDAKPDDRERRNLHPDICIIGAGLAGLAAALEASEAGASVVLCDESGIAEKLPPGPDRARVEELARLVRQAQTVTVLENAPAVGIYEGPLVVINERTFLHLVHPQRIVVATGAVEAHEVFPGNDLLGVWLSRGAARLACAHSLAPGRHILLIANTKEAEAHAQTLQASGAAVSILRDATVVEARGRRGVEEAVVEQDGRQRRYKCDALVLATGFVPRDGLARQAEGLPVVTVGDAHTPGCGAAEAEASGRAAARAESGRLTPDTLAPAPTAGIVCLCEDVGVEDLDLAWHEGFRSTEIIKRYTTATMGPCQGALCQRHIRSYVASKDSNGTPASAPTTARPPTRPITLEEVAAGVRDEIHQHTALHERHLALGAVMEPAGAWQRPERYGDVLDEYWSVRRGVSVMDVGTLGKYLVAGPDATSFLDHLYPCSVRDLEPGRLRYALLLGEHGFVVDDGVICALEKNRWYVTFTSAGAALVEAVLHDWADTLNLDVHLVNLTAATGAINVAGPNARTLLERLTGDPIDKESFPYLRHREITVAGVRCRALRLGFVGELSFELHHPSAQSVQLWDALLDAGADLAIRPHGLEALRLLRLEKGHIIIGQDTDFDATPAKLNMPWAARLEKPAFLGKHGLLRANAAEMARKLVALSFEAGAPPEGCALHNDGRYVGYVSSSRYSPTLARGVALGWILRDGAGFPGTVAAAGFRGTVVGHAFYDPEGSRLRA